MKKSTLLMSLALLAGSLCGNAATVTTTVMDATVEGSLLKVVADAPAGELVTVDFNFEGTGLALADDAMEIDLIGKKIVFEGLNKFNNAPVVLSSVNRLFKIGAGSDITFNNLAFTGCNNIAMTVAGDAKLTMTNCEAYKNKDMGKKVNGSVIRVSGGTVVIDKCYFHDNVSKGSYGGTICAYDVVNLRVTNSSFVHNTGAQGGAIAINGRKDKAGVPSLYVANCTFANNYAADRGGAIYVQTANAEHALAPVFVNNTFVGNFSGNVNSDDGGAMNMWARATAQQMKPVLVNNLFAQNFFDPWTKNRLNDIKCFYLEGDFSGETPQPQTVVPTLSNNIFAAVEDKFVTVYGNVNGNKILNFDTDKVFKATNDLHPEDIEGEPPYHKVPVLEGTVPAATLGEGSIAIGAGVATMDGVEIPTTDAFGTSRGATPAVGAVEFGSVGAVNSVVANETSIWKVGNMLQVSGIEQATLYIYDMTGKLVKTYEVSDNTYVMIDSLTNGFYIAKVNDSVCKFVK